MSSEIIPAEMKCRICNNAQNNTTYHVTEMMFGYKDNFTYFQCSKCKCLQIAEIPSDMSKYYPSNYVTFSLQRSTHNCGKVKSGVMKLFRKERDKYAVLNKGIIGLLLYRKFPKESLRNLFGLHHLSGVRLTKHSNILDVGCGAGSDLYAMRELGFKNLLGVDPYIKEDIEYDNGLRILKKTIHHVDGEFDYIVFHHSFEHTADPLETLQSVSRLLSKEGVCHIRIPTVSSYAWEHYGVNWVQLDAPRHFFLHSVESIKILAEKANLSLETVVFDSTGFQFWGSEQYIKGIPLISDRSYEIDPSNSMFSDAQIKVFKQKAKQLNSENRGDEAVFYLSKE